MISHVVFAASFFKNDNAMETVRNLAIPAVAIVGLVAIVSAFRRQIATALIMGVIVVIGLGFIGLANSADDVATKFGDVLRGLLP